MPSLSIDAVTKQFGARRVLDKVSLEIKDREFVSIVGPSGCGKTTLLRLVAGLEEVDQGAIRVGEEEVQTLPPRQRDVAMVFQGESLYPHLTVADNLAFPLRMRGDSDREGRIEETATQLGVKELLTRMPSTLSGGERQRVALGRALVRDPRVLLLDEPFAHLDLPLRRRLARDLIELREHWQATTIFVSHDHEEAFGLASRVAVLNAGAIQQYAAPDAIRREPANAFVAEFVRE